MQIADITIVPVPSENRNAYLEFSQRMAAVYLEYGATRVEDYWQSSAPAKQTDFHVEGAPYGPDELRSLASLVGARQAESVVVTVMIWPSREVRDRGVRAASQDRRVLDTVHEAPVFDGGRVSGDAFELILALEGEA